MLEALLAALAGLLIGSFLNVCIYRLPLDLSVVSPRSFCPNCDKPVAWYDNIPLLSFAILGGRCRRCRERILWRYPLVELLTAAVFFYSVYRLGLTPAAIKFCVFGAILITLIFSDLEEQILPDEFTKGGIIAGIVFAWFIPLPPGLPRLFIPVSAGEHVQSASESIFAAAFCAGALWLVAILYEKLRHKEGLGFGDVKMAAMIGAFMGLQAAMFTLIVGSLLGSIVGLLFIWTTGKDASTYELPFGSFLGIAALGVAFFGEPVLGWYIHLASG